MPGVVPAELVIVVAAQRPFQRHAAELLLPGEIEAGVALLITVRQVVGARFGGLFLPVDAATNRALADLHGVAPL